MKYIVRKYLPECVYGGVDGLVTTFAIVTASIGIGASAGTILVLGIANVLADAWSMGSSDYLSSHSEADMGEGNHDVKPPFNTAFATFASFVIIGFVPLVPFIIALFIPSFTLYATWTAVGATMMTFILVGYISGTVSGASRKKSAIRTFIVGAVAAIIAFGVGYVLRDLA
ncbi:MAG: VIT1/CCC1 transporter family protein [Patescibacteria group bacterium]